MALVLRWLARLALVLHLACVHVALFRLWYASGLRKMFTRKENVHVKDLLLAISIAEAGGGVPQRAASVAAGSRDHLALLFMLRRRLDHLETWRGWLEPELGRTRPRVSLYFHLADGAQAAEPEVEAAVAALRTLPGFRQIIPSVATGWCELMAAEVALYKAALADDRFAEIFVLLPHDSVPFAPLGTVLKTLLQPGVPPRTRLCPAGVRGLEVPVDCPHAIEPHWSRSLLLKHHQWMALTRAHAARMVDGRTLRAAVAVFQEWFLGEPLCSDEVLPLLALAMPEALVPSRGPVPALLLQQLPLYVGACRGLAGFASGLRAIGAAAECVTYAPWTGCHLRPMGRGKREKSPVLGGGLSPAERDRLIVELAGRGILFGRKLGVGGGNASGHNALIQANAPAGPVPPAPPRLLPDPAMENGATLFGSVVRALLGIPTWMKWGLSSMEVLLPVHTQVALATVVGALAGWVSVQGEGINATTMWRLLAVYVAGHCAVFFLSVALFAEYSLWEPFRSAGSAAKAEI